LERARASGQLTPHAPERDAWIINQLVMAAFHYYSFAEDDGADTVADDVWQFCLAAVGGTGSVTRSSRRGKPTRGAAGRRRG
jgi:hypothetical protein